MDSLISCEICMEFFDVKERIPKVLSCGHTLCSVCLLNIGNSCPSCTQKVPTSAAEVPTNLLVLSLFGKDSSQLQKETIEKHAKKLKETLLAKIDVIENDVASKNLRKESIEDDLVNIKKDITSKNLWKESIESDLVKLEQIVSAEDCSLSEQEKKDLLKEIKERNSGVNELKDKQDDGYVLLEAFKSTAQFLSHIKCLLEEGKKVFACHKVRYHMKYGEVLYKKEYVLSREGRSRRDLLIMKSLSESEAEEDAAVIWYSDLQKCFTADNFFIRLVFLDKKKEEKVFVFRPSESRILPQLIQLCTGEKGPTYKGAKVILVEKGNDEYEVTLLSYVVDEVPTRGTVDPFVKVFLPKKVNRAVIPEEVICYVEVNEEGLLKILSGPRNKANKLRNRHDVAFYSCDYFGYFLWRDFEDVVVDCGIAIHS